MPKSFYKYVRLRFGRFGAWKKANQGGIKSHARKITKELSRLYSSAHHPVILLTWLECAKLCVKFIQPFKDAKGEAGPYGCQPKNRGILPTKWMVNIRKNTIRIDDLGGFTTPLFFWEIPISGKHTWQA